MQSLNARSLKDIPRDSQERYKEINVSVESQTRWRINFYSAYLNDSDLLKCSDIIWLNHSEKDATLAIQKRVTAFRGNTKQQVQ